ncbi:polyketide synthase modules and related proteins [Candidatus Scalindua japonica]|uniref:Polyketide synthase modules and related proteins n=1 Tax=Candidatus Scalindua japonica TaxID=1284222 RepID=A0A286TTE1_9BACT|nr:polyketide synthase [Candidatus Scalindua japonica]GAX59133.1 polyketide synthase modules and related proteins [Candidatus Scalindua japonica]
MRNHKRFKPEYNDSDIAIIGMACRFAESQTPDEFWQSLTTGKDLICEIPPDRWDYHSWFDPSPQTPGKTYSKWGSFIKDIDKFDPSFFNMSPLEAELMDPQLRLLLSVLYETVEDAGYARNIWGTKTGMFVGAWTHEYRDQIIKSIKGNNLYKELGNHASMLANRPSYFFDLRGPSLSVDTACSSSLVALHLACKSLHHGECDMAFVGSANLLLSPLHYLWLCELGVLSPTGRCHIWLVNHYIMANVIWLLWVVLTCF